MNRTHLAKHRIGRRRFLGAAVACGAFGGTLIRSLTAEETTPQLVHDDIAQAMGEAELSMLYQGDSAPECRRWQRGFRAKLNELLGDSQPPLSYGGRMTMLTTAVDDRIKVAAVSGALNMMQERMAARFSCGSQIIPGLLKYGDHPEIGSLIAPRPCVWETGSNDSLIVPKWDERFRDRLRKAYASLNASEHLHFDKFEGGHEWSGRIAFPLFDEVLKG